VNYPHGGGVEAAARSWQCDISEVLDLSTGLHPAGPPEWVSEWVRQHASLIAHYPDRYGEPARAALAEEFSGVQVAMCGPLKRESLLPPICSG